MTPNNAVDRQTWLNARLKLLEREKEMSKLRDDLSRMRRDLPWVQIEKEYLFDGPQGRESLADLFDGRHQLIVYHFMFDPEWDEGCKSCSLIADHYEPAIVHLAARDVTLVTVSRAPLEKLVAFQRRMGWDFKWLSSANSDFNWDFHVSFTPEQLKAGDIYYNYRQGAGFPVAEAPGMSAFFKDDEDRVFHTYSTYARGLDMFLGVYHLLDIVPRGRDEDALPYGMAWVRHHDRYGDDSFVDPYVQLQAGD